MPMIDEKTVMDSFVDSIKATVHNTVHRKKIYQYWLCSLRNNFLLGQDERRNLSHKDFVLDELLRSGEF